MKLIKKLFELLVALSKLGWAHLVDFLPRKAQKFFDDLEKKPQETQSKNGVSEYISLKGLSEEDESRRRQEFMLKEYDFSEYAEVNEFTLKQKKI